VDESGSVDGILNWDQLREITTNDPDLMREIVAMLIDDTSRQMQLLDAAIRERDAPQCMRLAHYSKGACANVGANSAAALFKRIEGGASSGDFAGCGSAFAALSQEIALLRAAAVNI
jgi:HPt (histidine-containing phosphotransfer) domain-containing protein